MTTPCASHGCGWGTSQPASQSATHTATHTATPHTATHTPVHATARPRGGRDLVTQACAPVLAARWVWCVAGRARLGISRAQRAGAWVCRAVSSGHNATPANHRTYRWRLRDVSLARVVEQHSAGAAFRDGGCVPVCTRVRRRLRYLGDNAVAYEQCVCHLNHDLGHRQLSVRIGRLRLLDRVARTACEATTSVHPVRTAPYPRVATP